MSLHCSLSDVFLMVRQGFVFFEIRIMKVSKKIIIIHIKDLCFWNELLMLIVITWLGQCLSNFSTVKSFLYPTFYITLFARKSLFWAVQWTIITFCGSHFLPWLVKQSLNDVSMPPYSISFTPNSHPKNITRSLSSLFVPLYVGPTVEFGLGCSLHSSFYKLSKTWSWARHES